MKRVISCLLCAMLLLLAAVAAGEDDNAADSGEAGFSAVSPYVIFMDMNTGRVLYEKNADEMVSPASTVKIMTAILALENLNLDDKAEASETALSAVPEGVTAMELQPGEGLTVRQLLYGAMLASAADATNVLAEAVSGSISDFVRLMNEKAAELGMNSTHFSNTHGEHDDRTYTTVRDMAVLTRYAMKNTDFREIVNTDRYTVPPTDKHPEARDLVNTNYMVSKVQRKDYYYENAIGVKAGYTTQAKSCLIEVARKDSMELLALTFGAESVDGKAQGYIDCRSFFDTAFENYKTSVIVKKGALIDQIPVKYASGEKQVLLEAQDDLYYIYPTDTNPGEPTWEVNVGKYAKAPVKKGDVVGSCDFFYGEELAGTVNLVADKDYDFSVMEFISSWIWAIVGSPWFVVGIIGILILYIYIILRRRRIRREKLRRQRMKRRREAQKRMMTDEPVDEE